MSKNSNSTIKCECGSTIKSTGYKQHSTSNKHRNFIKMSEGKTDELIPRKSKFTERTIDESSNLNNILRYSSNQLRAQPRVVAIQNLRESIDPYTKADIILETGKLSKLYEVDHIHEVQVFVYAIRHVPQLPSRLVEHIRTEINSVSNLVITDASVNKSKGQAVKTFLKQLDTASKQPLLAALVQIGAGELSRIAPFASHIAGLICKYSNIMIRKFYVHYSITIHK